MPKKIKPHIHNTLYLMAILTNVRQNKKLIAQLIVKLVPALLVAKYHIAIILFSRNSIQHKIKDTDEIHLRQLIGITLVATRNQCMDKTRAVIDHTVTDKGL